MTGNGKYLIVVIIVLMNIILVSAANPSFGYFKKDVLVDLRQECFINGSICDACNITSISYPINSSRAIEEVSMNQNTNDFNYTFKKASVNGRYDVRGYCTFGGDIKKPFTAYFVVNYAGQPLSTAQGILYVVLLVLSLFFFFLTLYGAVAIPWREERDVEGQVVSVNDFKYLKIFFWGFAYVILVWISFLAMGISRNFLVLDGANNFFFLIWRILITMLIPVVLCSTAIAILIIIQNKKINKAIERGLPIR